MFELLVFTEKKKTKNLKYYFSSKILFVAYGNIERCFFSSSVGARFARSRATVFVILSIVSLLFGIGLTVSYDLFESCCYFFQEILNISFFFEFCLKVYVCSLGPYTLLRAVRYCTFCGLWFMLSLHYFSYASCTILR